MKELEDQRVYFCGSIQKLEYKMKKMDDWKDVQSRANVSAPPIHYGGSNLGSNVGSGTNSRGQEPKNGRIRGNLKANPGGERDSIASSSPIKSQKSGAKLGGMQIQSK